MENQQLLDYIRQQLQQGVDKETIKNLLFDQGWQKSDLDQAFLQIQSLDTITQAGILQKHHYFLMKRVFIIAGIILIVIMGALWNTGLLNFGYLFVKESLTPTKQKVSIIADDKIVPKKILEHKSFITLGINFPKENGNSADIYMFLVGTLEKPGTWSTKYEGKKEEEIFLDLNDINMLLQMASREKFSLYPEHFSLPATPLDFLGSQPPSFGTMRLIARRAITTANQLDEQGKKAEAEKLIQSLLVIGRQLEDSTFNTEIQWLTGIAIEKIAAEGLQDFYSKNGNTIKSNLLNIYVQEVDAIKKQFSNWSEKTANNMIVAMTLYFQILVHPSPSRVFVRTLYQNLKTTEEEFQTWLNVYKSVDDSIIQMGMIFPMLILKNTDGLEPERSIAEAILRQYTKSNNSYVAEYSQKALNISSEQFLQWSKENKGAE